MKQSHPITNHQSPKYYLTHNHANHRFPACNHVVYCAELQIVYRELKERYDTNGIDHKLFGSNMSEFAVVSTYWTDRKCNLGVYR